MPRLAMQIFHDFFYAGPEESRHGKSHVSFDGNVFFSYYTVIGQKEVAKDGTNVLLVSYWSMSATTGGHISALKSSTPPGWTMLQFPFAYGNHYRYSMNRIREAYEAEIKSFTDRDMSNEKNRWRYAAFSGAYRRCCELFDWPEKDTRETLMFMDKMDAVVKAVEDKREEARKRREEKAEKNSQKRIEQYRKSLSPVFEEFKRLGIENISIGELAWQVFGMSSRYYEEDLHNALRAWLTVDGGRFSFTGESRPFEEFLPVHMARCSCKTYRPSMMALVWQDGNLVKTSMGVSVSINHVKEAFRVFDSLENKSAFLGYRLHTYSVMQITDNIMQIGCHCIPIENINSLRKIVFKEAVSDLTESN